MVMITVFVCAVAFAVTLTSLLVVEYRPWWYLPLMATLTTFNGVMLVWAVVRAVTP